MFLRVSAESICLTSTPSTKIAPSVGSSIPATSRDRVDLPDPILPTIATFWPAGILNERLCRIGWLDPSNLNATFLNSTSPLNFGLLIGD